MVSEIMDMVFLAFGSCANWFLAVVNETGTYTLWLSCVFIWLFYRFLFAPVFGVAKSDIAKNAYNAFRRGKEE